ncbi:MAG: DUF6797 domain-containing protein [Planctomycetota bacterium]
MNRAAAAVCSLLVAAAAAAQGPSWPYSMDLGPYLMTTLEGGGKAGDTIKAVVIKVGNGAVAFDTELLRLSAAWTDGWLQLRGTTYDGAHGPMVRLRGRKVAETAVGPGWARGGELADPRPIVDGPLPREWGKYRGLRLVGDQVVVGYTVGDMLVREGYGMLDGGVVTRTLELAPSAQEQVMVVADGPDGAGVGTAEATAPLRMAMLQWAPAGAEPVEIAGTAADWSTLAMGGPSADDFLDRKSGTGATIEAVGGFARAHGQRSGPGPLPVLNDGTGPDNEDDPEHCAWFERSKVGGRDTDVGRFHVDLQRVVDVSRIDTFTWHRAERSRQRYDVYGSAAEAPDLAARDPEANGWTRIASVDTEPLGEGDKHAAGIHREAGLGAFRHLLFHVRRGGAFFCEIDVFADRFRAPVDTAARSRQSLLCALRGDAGELRIAGGRVLLHVPAHDQPVRLQVLMAAGDEAHIGAVAKGMLVDAPVAPLPKGASPLRWGGAIETRGELGAADGALAVDTIAIPFDNRFGSRMRTAAFDFFSDGRAAVSTWNGDVWILSGIDATLGHLQWKRFATGLFDPLGLRIVDDVIYVHGRDGLTRLRDTDQNGEADFIECFNNDVCATHAFHEFAFDLQTDADGNFFFSKAGPVNPGGRGFMRIAPHHGTICRVSKDGSRLDVIATGLRAPNGIGVSPTGIVTSGDNEGTYVPRCRINWIEKPGYYGGVKDTAHRQPVPDAPDLPLCWMPMEVDNSSGGQVWVDGQKPWADLDGRMLHLSYGTCSLYLVLTERVDDRMQGGVVRLPANFTSSCMRARFSPIDGQLYVIGLQGWQTSAAKEGGFHRVRRLDAPFGLPVALRTCTAGVYLTFDTELDPETANDPDSYGVEIWNYLYSGNYGSPEVSVLHPERTVEQGKPNRDPLRVTAAKLGPDGRTVFLAIDGMQPVNQMKITWNVDDKGGKPHQGELHDTIHALAADPGFPGAKR